MATLVTLATYLVHGSWLESNVRLEMGAAPGVVADLTGGRGSDDAGLWCEKSNPIGVLFCRAVFLPRIANEVAVPRVCVVGSVDS